MMIVEPNDMVADVDYIVTNKKPRQLFWLHTLPEVRECVAEKSVFYAILANSKPLEYV